MGYLRLINDFDDLCRRLGANKAFTETSIDISREFFLYLDFLLQGDIPNSRVDAREHPFSMFYRLPQPSQYHREADKDIPATCRFRYNARSEILKRFDEILGNIDRRDRRVTFNHSWHSRQTHGGESCNRFISVHSSKLGSLDRVRLEFHHNDPSGRVYAVLTGMARPHFVIASRTIDLPGSVVFDSIYGLF
jgi:hypothetical protein